MNIQSLDRPFVENKVTITYASNSKVVKEQLEAKMIYHSREFPLPAIEIFAKSQIVYIKVNMIGQRQAELAQHVKDIQLYEMFEKIPQWRKYFMNSEYKGAIGYNYEVADAISGKTLSNSLFNALDGKLNQIAVGKQDIKKRNADVEEAIKMLYTEGPVPIASVKSPSQQNLKPKALATGSEIDDMIRVKLLKMSDEELQRFKKYSAPEVSYRCTYEGYKNGIIIEALYTESMTEEPHPRLNMISELASILGADPHRFEKVFGKKIISKPCKKIIYKVKFEEYAWDQELMVRQIKASVHKVAYSEQEEKLIGGILKEFVTPVKVTKTVEMPDMDEYEVGELYPEAFGMIGTAFDVREPSVILSKSFTADLEVELQNAEFRLRSQIKVPNVPTLTKRQEETLKNLLITGNQKLADYQSKNSSKLIEKYKAFVKLIEILQATAAGKKNPHPSFIKMQGRFVAAQQLAHELGIQNANKLPLPDVDPYDLLKKSTIIMKGAQDAEFFIQETGNRPMALRTLYEMQKQLQVRAELAYLQNDSWGKRNSEWSTFMDDIRRGVMGRDELALHLASWGTYYTQFDAKIIAEQKQVLGIAVGIIQKFSRLTDSIENIAISCTSGENCASCLDEMDLQTYIAEKGCQDHMHILCFHENARREEACSTCNKNVNVKYTPLHVVYDVPLPIVKEKVEKRLIGLKKLKEGQVNIGGVLRKKEDIKSAMKGQFPSIGERTKSISTPAKVTITEIHHPVIMTDAQKELLDDMGNMQQNYQPLSFQKEQKIMEKAQAAVMIVDNDTDLKAEKDKRLAVEEEKKKLEDRLREQDYRSQMEKSKNQQLIEEMKQAMQKQEAAQKKLVEQMQAQAAQYQQMQQQLQQQQAIQNQIRVQPLNQQQAPLPQIAPQIAPQILRQAQNQIDLQPQIPIPYQMQQLQIPLPKQQLGQNQDAAEQRTKTESQHSQENSQSHVPEDSEMLNEDTYVDPNGHNTSSQTSNAAQGAPKKRKNNSKKAKQKVREEKKKEEHEKEEQKKEEQKKRAEPPRGMMGLNRDEIINRSRSREEMNLRSSKSKPQEKEVNNSAEQSDDYGKQTIQQMRTQKKKQLPSMATGVNSAELDSNQDSSFGGGESNPSGSKSLTKQIAGFNMSDQKKQASNK